MASMLRQCRFAKAATAGVLVAALLLASVLAISPHLHAVFHHVGHVSPESHPTVPADHQCVATLLAKGALDVPTPALLGLEYTPALGLRLPLCEDVLLPLVAFRLLPERAPPVS